MAHFARLRAPAAQQWGYVGPAIRRNYTTKLVHHYSRALHSVTAGHGIGRGGGRIHDDYAAPCRFQASAQVLEVVRATAPSSGDLQKGIGSRLGI